VVPEFIAILRFSSTPARGAWGSILEFCFAHFPEVLERGTWLCTALRLWVAATAGGLCFLHANPNKASELGWIGGRHDEGQDIAEYAVMLAVILVIVVGTIRLVGSNANNVFSATASALQ